MSDHEAIRSHAEKVREAAERATPGPWDDYPGVDDVPSDVLAPWEYGQLTVAECPDEDRGEADATLIALCADPEIARAVWAVAVAAEGLVESLARLSVQGEAEAVIAELDTESEAQDAIDRLRAVLEGRE